MKENEHLKKRNGELLFKVVEMKQEEKEVKQEG